MKYPIKLKYSELPLYFLILLSLILFFGAVIYRLYKLDVIGVFFSLMLAIISFIIILQIKKINNNNGKIYFNDLTNYDLLSEKKYNTPFYWATLPYIFIIGLCFYTLLSKGTTASIVSPWQVIPGYFYFLCLISFILLILLILKFAHNQNFDKYLMLLIIIQYFLFFSVALFIYKIGFGFDQFIHQATENLIDKTGSVAPKPFYYLGQYSIVVIMHKLTSLPIAWLDKLLVPLMAAVFLPFAFWLVFKKWGAERKTSLLTILFMLILTFSPFIVTTPQNFSYLLLILVILFSATCNSYFDLIVIYLLSFAALVFHPIAGIPAIMLSLLVTVYHSDKNNLKKYFYILIFVVSTVSLPLSFYFLSKGADINKEADILINNDTAPPGIVMPSQENFILNFVYLYGFNIKAIICLIALIGMIIAFRNREKYKIFFLYSLMSFSLLISYLMAKKLPFDFLIAYERNNYPGRILLMAALFLLPFLALALLKLIEKIIRQKSAIKIPLISFLLLLLLASLYLSYPRFDKYFNSRGYSTGQSDIEAVNWIEKNKSEDYIVLANQQVSAAALREFGFKKYYIPNSPGLAKRSGAGKFQIPNSKIFYYPIPTGGPLYRFYLDMVYKKPSHETMIKAMDLAGVKEGYFVLNKYWWAFPKILEEAKLEADSWQEFGRGEVYVFRYKKSQSY